MGGTPIRVRKGCGVFYISKHCEQRMLKRKIRFKEMKETVRSGVIIYERPGVCKIVSNTVHIVFEEGSKRIYTVYRPYIYDDDGNIIGNTE
jgi:hypothetical protein